IEIVDDILTLSQRRSKDLHSQIDLLSESLESVDIKLKGDSGRGLAEIIENMDFSGSEASSTVSSTSVKETTSKPSIPKTTQVINRSSEYDDLFKG
ncbi:MAG: hypothetical protein OIF32_00705, partial [Campylobacterales bacterium]|nr:hypothetical protein [Campylobacterales bacterium]